MDEITVALAAATGVFAAVITLAILVTGFFVGRKWLKKVGEYTDADYERETDIP